VRSVNVGSDTFFIEYDDGDEEDDVKLEWIKWRRGESEADRAAYAPQSDGSENVKVGCRVEAQVAGWQQAQAVTNPHHSEVVMQSILKM
jgi:hypothetical protein